LTDQQPQPQRQYDQNQRSNIPVPDPSILTTAALEREVSHLRELIGGKVDDLARDFDRFKEAHGNRHADAVDSAIEHLSELCEVKFAGIQQQFHDRDIRFEQRDVAAREAIAAALAAAEKSVGKSEATFTKEIDALKELIATTAKAQDQQIRDIKDEQTGSRGRAGGIDKTWALMMTLAPIVISVVGVAIVIATR
jgi:hypothetical protein